MRKLPILLFLIALLRPLGTAAQSGEPANPVEPVMTHGLHPVGWEFLLSLANDSVIHGQDSTDNGYTHGLTFAVVARLQNKTHVALTYSTNLFTKKAEEQPADGSFERKYFTTENVVTLTADNIDRGKRWYWTGGLGWQQLDSTPGCIFLEASCQQLWFHDLVGGASNVLPAVHVSDGRGVRNGALFTGGAGLQQAIKAGPLRLKVREQAGYVAATMPDVSHGYVNGNAAVAHAFWEWLRLEAGVTFLAKAHQAGVEYNPGLRARVDLGRTALQLDYIVYHGSVQNYVIYNTPEPNGKYDPTLIVALRRRFGR